MLTLSQFFETLMCWFWSILNIKFLWHLTYHKLMTLWEQSRSGQSPPVLPPLNGLLCHAAWLNTDKDTYLHEYKNWSAQKKFKNIYTTNWFLKYQNNICHFCHTDNLTYICMQKKFQLGHLNGCALIEISSFTVVFFCNFIKL